jgi:uncharacterized protein YbaR (Trm112 family)
MTDAIDPNVLAIMVCPESHAPLVQDGEWLCSTDPKTRRRYQIREGIPVMLIDESEVMDQADWREVMTRHGKLPQ